MTQLLAHLLGDYVLQDHTIALSAAPSGSAKVLCETRPYERRGAMWSDAILVAGPTPWGRDIPWSPA